MASYLPLLLSSVSSQHIPSDDTSLSTQARGQVDYLSHEWNEEDVARSWRNMTRQKNDIANGPRLENASWRTWWKQRNKLKTISPETLNWLKDSDVTWLYGPLHTAIDWSPPPRPKADPTSVDKEDRSTADRLHLAVGLSVKPILKHRTIGELLTSALPTSHDDYTANFDDGFIEDASDRPLITQTRSDSNVIKWHREQNTTMRKQSPPRIVAETSQEPSTTPSPQLEHPPGLQHSNSSDSANGSSTDLAARANKRHITFNTFVEQCIAIDSPPNNQKKKPSPDGRWAQYEDYDHDDGYDEDSEAGFNDLDDGTTFSDHDTDDEEEPQLEIQTAAARARSAAQIYIHQPPPYPHHRVIAPTFKPKPKKRTSSLSSREDHVTIAPIAPTMLKTTGVGNHYLGVDDQNNLVYMPPERSGGSGHSSPARVLSSEDVYRHRGARWDSNGNLAGSSSSTSSSRSPHRPLVASPDEDDLMSVPTAIAQAAPMPYGPPSPGAGLLLKPGALRDGTESDDMVDSSPANADYFGSSPATAPPIFRHTSHEDLVDIDVQEVETYQPTSEEDMPEPQMQQQPRSPPKPTLKVDQPSVSVVIDEPSPRVGRERSRSRSRSRSHSRTPSPADLALEHARRENQSTAPVSIPRRASSQEALLSPERAGAPIARSYSMDGVGSSSGSERGRARDKSALSDRERSASRTPGTGSPFGSVSPTGIAGPTVYASNGRKRVREEGESSNGRGRRRAGSNDSLGSASSSQPASSVSPVGRSPGPGASGDMRSLDAGVEESRRGSIPTPVKVPPTIGEEDEACSRTATPRAGEVTPTPFNSPAKAFEPPKVATASGSKLAEREPASPTAVPAPASATATTTSAVPPTTPPAPKNASVSPKRVYPSPASPTTATYTQHAKRERTASGESVTSGSESEGPHAPGSPTLVGRAASAAKGLLGSIW